MSTTGAEMEPKPVANNQTGALTSRVAHIESRLDGLHDMLGRVVTALDKMSSQRESDLKSLYTEIHSLAKSDASRWPFREILYTIVATITIMSAAAVAVSFISQGPTDKLALRVETGFAAMRDRNAARADWEAKQWDRINALEARAEVTARATAAAEIRAARAEIVADKLASRALDDWFSRAASQ